MKLNDKLNQSSNEIKCHTHRTRGPSADVWVDGGVWVACVWAICNYFAYCLNIICCELPIYRIYMW